MFELNESDSPVVFCELLDFSVVLSDGGLSDGELPDGELTDGKPSDCELSSSHLPFLSPLIKLILFTLNPVGNPIGCRSTTSKSKLVDTRS